MIGFLLVLAFPIGEIKTLIDNYIDIKMQSIDMHESMTSTAEKLRDPDICNSTPTPSSFCQVPVALPKKQGFVYAKVSPEDYFKVSNASSNWRLCSSGYPIFVKRKESKFTTTYMHRLVHGDSARHLNGDRLDNRRENLVDSERGPPAPRKVKTEPMCLDVETDQFLIKTPKIVCEELYNFNATDPDLKQYTGFANIKYRENKNFSGEIKNGIPHGYGHLYEASNHTQSCGSWENGQMTKGMVLQFKPLPQCMCETWSSCPNREVEKLDVVKNGYRT